MENFENFNKGGESMNTEEQKEKERGEYWKEKVERKQKEKRRPIDMTKAEWEEEKTKRRAEEKKDALKRKVFGKN